MRYYVMPAGIWAVFCRPFRRNLVQILGFEKDEAKTITMPEGAPYCDCCYRRKTDQSTGLHVCVDAVSEDDKAVE